MKVTDWLGVTLAGIGVVIAYLAWQAPKSPPPLVASPAPVAGPTLPPEPEIDGYPNRTGGAEVGSSDTKTKRSVESIPAELIAPGEQWEPITLAQIDWLIGDWCEYYVGAGSTTSIRRGGDGITYRYQDTFGDDSGTLPARVFSYGSRLAVDVPGRVTFFVDGRDGDRQWTYFNRRRNDVNELTSRNRSPRFNCSKCSMYDDGIGSARVNCAD